MREGGVGVSRRDEEKREVERGGGGIEMRKEGGRIERETDEAMKKKGGRARGRRKKGGMG